MTTTYYTVAVFPHVSQKPGRKPTVMFSAYLRDYSPEWEGCNLIRVSAENGKRAKQIAISEIKDMLLFGSREERSSIRIAPR